MIQSAGWLNLQPDERTSASLSTEMPELVPLIDDEDKREAVIGVGEPSIIPSVGALANAVYNACGVRVRELPITPDKILSGLMQERRGA